MERNQAPRACSGKDARAELERTQTELAATRRKLQELEGLVAARTAEAAKWEARTRRQPRPDSEFRVAALLLGLIAGLFMARMYIHYAGGTLPPPMKGLETKPEWSVPSPLYGVP